MTRIGRATELIGRPVITLDSATALGEIRDVLFDPGRARVIGFTLRGRGLLSSGLVGILPGEWVHSIGRDALIVPSASAVVTDRAGMDTAVGDQQEVIGKEVVTETGASLGTITDVVVELERATATVVGYEIDSADGRSFIVPADERTAMSADAVVLPAESQRRSANGLSAFRDGLERERSARVGAGA